MDSISLLTSLVWCCLSLLLLDGPTYAQTDSDANHPVHVPIFRSDHHILSLSNLSSLSLNAFDGAHQQSTEPVKSTTKPPHSTPSFGIDRLTRSLHAKLMSLQNTELAVPSIQQIFDDQLTAKAAKEDIAFVNDTQLVAQFALRLENKLQLAQYAINDAAKEIGQSQFNGLPTVVQPCPFDDWATALDQHYDKTQIEIKNYRAPPDRHLNWTVDEKASHQMIMQTLKGFRTGNFAFQRAYFVSNSDIGGQLVCPGTSVQEFRQLRSVLVSSINQKNLMVLIDHGGTSLNAEQLDLTKSFVHHLISLLNKRDRIAIVAVAGQSSTYYAAGGETTPRLYSGSRDNHAHFTRFIERLNATRDLTNHSFAFSEAFRRLHQIYQHQEASDAIPLQMVYISRGLVSPLTESKNVLESISAGQRLLRTPVVINTCAIVLDEKRVMYEKQFMKDLARQNYTKYGIDVTGWVGRAPNHNLTGRMMVINHQDNARSIIATAASIFERLLIDSSQINDQLSATLPEYVANTPSRDVTSSYGSDGELVVAMFKPVSGVGIVGVNMYLGDIVEDVVGYRRSSGGSYAFIVDRDGTAIWHPSYPRPIGLGDQTPFYTDVRHLQSGSKGFSHVRQRMLVEPFGSATDSLWDNRRITYTWHRSTDLYVICIATIHPTTPANPFGLFGVPADLAANIVDYHRNDVGVFFDETLLPELVFHRMDLIPVRGVLCSHFKQVTTMDSVTLFLSASSFSRPFVYLENYRKFTSTERYHNAISIMAYLRDTSGLLANPGLLPNIRNEVNTLFHAMSFLKKRHLAGDPHDKYIIRRFAATVNGVLQMFPGCVLSYDMEPIRRPWFVKALQHPGRLVLTEPYLDAGGAGYIVTLAHTIHSGGYHLAPQAVVAIDVTIGFLYKLLLTADPTCGSEPSIKCFLMEDAGFVLAHPSVLDPLISIKTSRRPLEHVTHIESYLANDILHHRSLVEKQLCANYANRKRQRYYRFNTSLTEVLTNRVHGERTKYQLTAIAGTNIFVAWLNATNDGGAFCPCSTLDRICLNCNRMEAKICECPCECPLFVNDEDNDEIVDNVDRDGNDETNEVCVSRPEQVIALDGWALDVDLELQTCHDMNCEMYSTQIDCLGVMGCEWCQVDVDAETFFSSPFCTQQSSCYNGVLGSATPYGGEGDLGVNIVDNIVPPSYSAIGPVIGAIVALCLVVGFAMYCYRQTVDGSSGENLYGGNSGQENAPFGMPLARFDYDDINPHEDGDLGGMNTMNRHLLQPQLVVPAADISPYRINAGNYRPAVIHHTESDHGYSTMTPREDSEHQCFALAEPLLRTKRVSSMSDSASVSTSVSSPTNHNCFPVDHPSPRGVDTLSPNKGTAPSPTTNLNATSPHHIQAPVTVHHPMEMV